MKIQLRTKITQTYLVSVKQTSKKIVFLSNFENDKLNPFSRLLSQISPTNFTFFTNS